MDSWKKYKDKNFEKSSLSAADLSKEICYGNYLISKIAWLASIRKLKQRHIDKFFNKASFIIQATYTQKGYNNIQISELYNYIEQVYKDLLKTGTNIEDYGLLLGNITELSDANYTFVELIGFIRAVATKI